MQTRRIPNLGHVLLFLVILFLAFLLCGGVGLLVFGARHTEEATQRLAVFAQILTYVIALIASNYVFATFWERPFLTGIHWNPAAARPLLIAVGLALGFAVQGINIFLPVPKDLPVEAIFHSPGLIWVLVLFGTILAPLCEEILYRGFLLPALAIAIDYIRLPLSRDPEEALATLQTWRFSDAFSTRALVISSIITSLLFGLMHGAQLGFSWPSVAMLAVVSLALCYIRIRTDSVAASTLVHGSYNLSVFISLFIQTGAFRHLDRV